MSNLSKCIILFILFCISFFYYTANNNVSEFSKKQYEIIDIKRPSENIQGDWYIFSDLNNNGQAVGYYVDANNMSWAFKWDKDNGYQKLESTNNSPCAAASINNKGQILGYFRDKPIDISPDGAMEILFPTKKKIVIWNTDGTIETISDWSEDKVSSMSINDQGVVFGQISKFTENKLRRYSFEWTHSTGMQFTELKIELSSSSRSNSSGEYFGYYNNIETGITIPYLINRDNQFSDLSKEFEKNLSNEPIFINDLQQITGTFATKGIGYETFLFSDKTGVTILPDLAGTRRSYPCSINNKGIVVGCSNSYENNQIYSYAVMWLDDKKTINLNSYLNEESNFKVLERASLINDSGQIIGFGQTKEGKHHSFIMNPIQNLNTKSATDN